MATKTALKKYIQQLKKSPHNLWGIPFDTLNVDECLALVQVTGSCLRKVPNAKRTKKVCIAAVENYPLALGEVPERLKTKEMCQNAYDKEIGAFPYMLSEMYTLELCIECYERLLSEKEIGVSLKTISSAMPMEFHQDNKIFTLERKLGIRKITDKKYEDGKFVVVEKVQYEENPLRNVFETFVEFYSFVDNDLKGADLYGYNFEGVNLQNVDLSEVYISTEVLAANGMYSDKFFRENVKAPEESTELVPYEPKEITYYASESGLSDDNRRIYYISDLHLNHKLQIQFKDRATENDVKYYIEQLVSQLVKTRTEFNPHDFLIIAGDVSYNFKISELFYTELVKKWEPEHIVVILGNHELWDYGAKEKVRNVEKIIGKYRKLFDRLGVQFLQNDLLITTGDYFSEVTVIKEKEILANSAEWLKEKCRTSRLTMFGGIGFSGENIAFNATQGIYRATIDSLEMDKRYTKAFVSVYDKIKAALNSMKVVALTHMPYTDWSQEEPIANWIYVCGHTHMNEYCIDENKTLYADNQVGYYTKSMGLKHFELTKHYDIFSDYEDGIYEISREQYIDFNRGLNVKITFNRSEGKIFMLKRDGIYCFLYRGDTGKIYLLKGGSNRKLEHQDIQYYYDIISVYKKAMEFIMHDYHEALKHISSQIKKIGGDGRIHGCIVDIDEMNHVYLNPVNGKIICYWASAINHRYEYPSFAALLQAEREDIYLTYLEKSIESKGELQIFEKGEVTFELEAVKIVSDTSMYKPSNMFRSLQYMFDVNVIREWNEEVVERAIDKYLNGVLKIEEKQ